MQATAQFVPDFITQIAAAKQASIHDLGGLAAPDSYVLYVSNPNFLAHFDALGYVHHNFPGCDRRRWKREMRKAMKRALAGNLPVLRMELTAEPIEMNGSVLLPGPADAGEFRGWRPSKVWP
jgi:hypothetical protein